MVLSVVVFLKADLFKSAVGKGYAEYFAVGSALYQRQLESAAVKVRKVQVGDGFAAHVAAVGDIDIDRKAVPSVHNYVIYIENHKNYSPSFRFFTKKFLVNVFTFAQSCDILRLYMPKVN